jgi:hypothetical protein
LGGDGSNPAAWSRTVALNLVRSQWRRSGTSAGAAHVLAASASAATEAPIGDVDLESALRVLPERQRESVVLIGDRDLRQGGDQRGGDLLHGIRFAGIGASPDPTTTLGVPTNIAGG